MAHPYNRITTALVQKDFAEASKIIEEGFDINSYDGGRTKTLLGQFVDKNDWDGVDWLLNNGADPNLPNNYNKTPLMVAIERGYEAFSIIERILEDSRTNLNYVGNYGVTAIYLAANHSNFEFSAETIKALLDRGANPNFRYEDGSTALMVAVRSADHYKAASYLMEAGADPTYDFTEGNNLLHVSIKSGSVKMAAKVYEYCRPYIQQGKINLHQKNTLGDTPAASAASRKSFAPLTLQMFWDGANPNDKSNHGLMECPTVLMSIISMDNDGSASILENALERNANLNLRDSEGRNLMFFVIADGTLNGRREVIEMMLENGFDFKAPLGPEGLSPFHAINALQPEGSDEDSLNEFESLRLKIAEYFIGLGFPTLPGAWIKPETNRKRYEDEPERFSPPALFAMQRGDYKMASFLLEKGTPINALDNRGMGLLHHLTSINMSDDKDFHAKMKNIVNTSLSREKSALPKSQAPVAPKLSDEEKKKLKEERAAAQKELKQQEYFAFFESLGAEIISFLTKHGADWNLQGANGDTPLHKFIQNQKNTVLMNAILYYTDASLGVKNDKEESVIECLWKKDIEMFAEVVGFVKAFRPEKWDQVSSFVCDLILASPEDLDSYKYKMWQKNLGYTFEIFPELMTISDADGNTPLIMAASTGQIGVVEELLYRGVNPNVQNNQGETALLQAVCSEFDSVSELLYAHGASEMIASNSGVSPQQVKDFSTLSQQKTDIVVENLNESALEKYQRLSKRSVEHYALLSKPTPPRAAPKFTSY